MIARDLSRASAVLAAAVLASALLLPSVALAQAAPTHRDTPPARAADVSTIDGIVAALYESVQRRPGEPFDWDRMRSLFHPRAVLVPSEEQRGGAFDVLTPEQFIEWIDGLTIVGGEADQGFAEEEIARRVERYGDVAQIFSTYRKHLWNDDEILGRGVNSILLVRHGGRWWILSIAWDEEVGAGPLPEEYLPDS